MSQQSNEERIDDVAAGTSNGIFSMGIFEWCFSCFGLMPQPEEVHPLIPEEEDKNNATSVKEDDVNTCTFLYIYYIKFMPLIGVLPKCVIGQICCNIISSVRKNV
jgi:hypothetical protein